MVIEHSNATTPSEGFDIDLTQEHLEPMLQENLDRFVLFPIEHSDIWEMYKATNGLLLDCRRNRFG